MEITRVAERVEEDGFRARLVNDAPLVAVDLRLARDTPGDGEADELPAAIDLELRDRVDLRP